MGAADELVILEAEGNELVARCRIAVPRVGDVDARGEEVEVAGTIEPVGGEGEGSGCGETECAAIDAREDDVRVVGGNLRAYFVRVEKRIVACILAVDAPLIVAVELEVEELSSAEGIFALQAEGQSGAEAVSNFLRLIDFDVGGLGLIEYRVYIEIERVLTALDSEVAQIGMRCGGRGVPQKGQ